MTDEKFLSAAKRVLDAAETHLDVATLAKLRAARREAIADGLNSKLPAWRNWLLPLSGMVAAGLVAVMLGLFWFSPSNNLIQANVDDVELLTAHESPEFFSDMEFYSWLDEDDNDSDAG